MPVHDLSDQNRQGTNAPGGEKFINPFDIYSFARGGLQESTDIGILLSKRTACPSHKDHHFRRFACGIYFLVRLFPHRMITDQLFVTYRNWPDPIDPILEFSRLGRKSRCVGTSLPSQSAIRADIEFAPFPRRKDTHREQRQGQPSSSAIFRRLILSEWNPLTVGWQGRTRSRP